MTAGVGVVVGGGVVVEPEPEVEPELEPLEGGGVTGVEDCDPPVDAVEPGVLDALPPPPPPLQAVMSRVVNNAAMIL